MSDVTNGGKKCEQTTCAMYAWCPFHHIIKNCRSAMSAIYGDREVEEID